MNHLKNTLKILNCAGYYCRIGQKGMSELNLKELNAYNNSKIKNVNHIKIR